MALFENLTAGTLLCTDAVTLEKGITFSGESSMTGVTLGTPTTGTITAVHENSGVTVRSTFTLTAAKFTATDAGGSGSYGTQILATLPAGSVSYLGCRQNYTAFAEGAALTGAAGDAAFVIGVGTVAIAAAADGALTTTSVDIGSATATITLSGGTGTGTKTNHTATAADGTSTAATINLNWSGSAATIDATSTIAVTGTITVLWALLGDD